MIIENEEKDLKSNGHSNGDSNPANSMEMSDKKPNYQSTETFPDQTRNTLRRGPMAHVNNVLTKAEESVVNAVKKHQKPVKITTAAMFIISYLVYFIFALSIDAERARNLIYVTVFGFFCLFYWFVKKYFGRTIWKNCLKPIQTILMSKWTILKWTTICIFFILVIVWIGVDTAKDPSRLVSLTGLILYILIGFIFSKKRDKVKWRPVIWGFALQFVFGLAILRTTGGYEFFKWLGDRISVFLAFSATGITFVFRPLNTQGIFAINVLPIIVYFSAVIYLIYYLGFMQTVIKKIAWLLQVTMGTSPAESVNAAGNIFLGQTEAPLLIRPFLQGMTPSELHAVMTGGFATIAGGVLAAYMCLGISPSHLLSASVMSAPAALAMAKLMYPETEEPEFKHVDEIEIEETEEKNVFEAIAVGASMSIGLVANITVMLIAFISILALANGTLSWLGSMVNQPDFSFELICSYLFMPFAFVMGVEWKDSFIVAELLGIKTFINEFVAYEKLSKLITNRVKDLDGSKISIRSEVICTYALCGFANFASMGVQIGGISVLAPNKREVLSRVALRALIAGTLACFMTACVAGVLYDESRYDTRISVNGTTSIC